MEDTGGKKKLGSTVCTWDLFQADRADRQSLASLSTLFNISHLWSVLCLDACNLILYRCLDFLFPRSLFLYSFNLSQICL